MNFQKPKLQFSMRSLLVWCVLTGIFAGVFARALFAEIVAQKQAVAVELQSERDWLIVLERDREKLIQRQGPFAGGVIRLNRMIKASKKSIKKLESQIDDQEVDATQ